MASRPVPAPDPADDLNIRLERQQFAKVFSCVGNIINNQNLDDVLFGSTTHPRLPFTLYKPVPLKNVKKHTHQGVRFLN